MSTVVILILLLAVCALPVLLGDGPVGHPDDCPRCGGSGRVMNMVMLAAGAPVGKDCPDCEGSGRIKE